jgi:FlaA1/EpsC-like NDP-sugar epimerase
METLFSRRRQLALLLYAGAAVAAYLSAFLLRFDFRVPAPYMAVFAWTVWPLVVLRLVAFRLFRLTRERWRYAGGRDAVRLVLATVFSSAVFLVLFRFALPISPVVPISVVATELVLMSWFTAAMWLSYRLTFEHLRQRENGQATNRVVVIGAGEAGNLLVREMLRFPTGYIPVGFVDDDPSMWGATIHGVEVVGAPADLQAIAQHVRAHEIIIAVPSARPADMRRLVAQCELTGLPFKVLPGIAQVFAGDVRLNQLRPVQIEDLLGREPITLELPELAADLRGSTVLITGAAGSIGSELARQVTVNGAARVIALDQAETNLFYLDQELRRLNDAVAVIPIVGDVGDAAAMQLLFERFTPDRVYHAAAYKHVPLMERNAREAIRNNVIGTRVVAELAGRFGAGKFVLVSTDKAVRPTNVMGATKRVAELLILELQTEYPATDFGAVRFGNVLGSSGSVLPIFKRQLEMGEPLTVTDRATTRYFMTIPEAVQLILQASLLPDLHGAVAMLDMGEPVRIMDLATNLLRLSGAPADDGNIVFTGLRPGEKLHEELAAPDEQTVATAIAKIRIIRSAITSGRIIARVAAWERALEDSDLGELRADFELLFPDVRLMLPESRAPIEMAAGD